ncbi:MAG: DNA sulfur modification protein DndB [Candidatus Methylomirabilota bacterium]|nr:MAG: DNA sulfur modification protein DndB [candidate division NC10 bacterium]
MKVLIPAIRGTMGGRQYFTISISLAEIPRLFRFNDWEQCTPELRAQRVLNKSRVPDIAKYILDNEDGYLFSSITASYSCEVKFTPINDNSDLGMLEMELENLELIINDGQHRSAGIAAALKENPALGKDKISVLLFPKENLDRLQQMFTDLNRYAHKTSKSLDILYDHRDNLSALTMDVSEQVEVFRGMVDKEKIAIPMRSPKLFTLATLYDANEELVGSKADKCGTKDYETRLGLAVQYWTALSNVVTDWRKAKEGDVKAPELRQEKINTHAVVMRALGGAGRALIEEYPKDWQKRLEPLREIDWRKSVGSKVNPLWDNVCITAGSVVSNRQARVETLAVLRRILGVSSVAREQKLLDRTRSKVNNKAEAQA